MFIQERGFNIKHFGLLPLHGEFNEFELALENSEGQIKFAGKAAVESITMKNDQLHGHLMSPE